MLSWGQVPLAACWRNRLSEATDVTVLVLEAGDADKSFLFHWPAGFAKMTKGIASWGWSTVPQRHMKNRALWYTQAKVVGGGSTINAQVYTRGNAKDYDAWADNGCEGWSYREILPYFKRAEGNERFADDYHGSDGPLGVSVPRGTSADLRCLHSCSQQYGIPYNPDFNGKQQAGTGYFQLTQRNVRRSSTATAFLRPALSRRNLTLRTRQQVRRIVVENGRATGIEVGVGGVPTLIRARREVLVTSGAIGSPRLLLLSGIGPADHLTSVGVEVEHDLPGVGQNLQDHLDLCALAECSGRHSYDGTDKFHRSAIAALQYFLFKSGPVTSSLFETGAFWYASDSSPARHAVPLWARVRHRERHCDHRQGRRDTEHRLYASRDPWDGHASFQRPEGRPAYRSELLVRSARQGNVVEWVGNRPGHPCPASFEAFHRP